ncbi:MAG: primosomal protein N' [Chloroflexota bacterium]|nr:primosomal protein N' [Chloroflexota bacterium]
MKYAEVAVNSPGAQRRTFWYAVPSFVQVGHAVWVPFGPRVAQGIVLRLTDQPSVDEVKDIVGLMDARPVLSAAQVELACWVSERYLAPLFDSAAVMLPPGFSRRLVTFVEPHGEASQAEIAALTPHQRKMLTLLTRRGKLPLSELENALGAKETRNVVAQLVRRKLVARTQELEGVKVRPKVVPYVRLAVGTEEARERAESLSKSQRAPKQAALLEFLATQARPIPVSEATRQVGCTRQVVKVLEDKGLASVEQVHVYRDPLAHRAFALAFPPMLTAAQESAWAEVQAAMARRGENGHVEPAVFLLHGVTGSGKTEIYLRALEQAVALGKKAIVLVPEIALTPQTIDRFASRFPGRVAVLHSRLSVGEQFDEWWRIRDGGFDVVIGSRGAVFAPQPDLGLIVIDEEHEWTYKQHDQTPRYQARDVAIKLAHITGSIVILGSATPDVVSYYRGTTGEYHLLELPERIDTTGYGREGRLPGVEVVDLRDELMAGNRSIFSRSLAAAMERALAAGEQAILFLNRRGAATFVQCRRCGFVLRCRRCDVPLTYHSAAQDLVCHQCNSRSPVPNSCPRCGSRQIKFLGIGTQRVAEEAGRVFPGARVLRWDRDVTGGKHSHEEILGRFLAHEADILVGTQMIAKGLELPLVTLVGVVNADVSLHLPDYRAGERTFEILSQVAGRAGRGPAAGRVIIQSYNPDHYAIVAASKHDYASFYEHEMALRREYDNPPFSRLARLVYTATNNVAAHNEALRMHQRLKQERDSWGMEMTLIGPAPAFVQRVRGRYRWQIILRGDDPVRLLDEVPVPQGWIVDIDPATLL